MTQDERIEKLAKLAQEKTKEVSDFYDTHQTSIDAFMEQATKEGLPQDSHLSVPAPVLFRLSEISETLKGIIRRGEEDALMRDILKSEIDLMVFKIAAGNLA